MLAIDVLINADQASFEYAEEAFHGVGVYITARPFKLGMIDAFVGGEAEEFKGLALIGNKATVPMRQIAKHDASAAMVNRDGTLFAAPLHKTENLHVHGARTLPRMARAAHFHVVGFNRFTNAAKRASIGGRCHHFSDAMAKMPSGFHTAAEHPLKLPRGNAFLRSAKQMDGLKPHAQGKVAILENGTLAHRKGRTTAGVTLAEADLDDRTPSRRPIFSASAPQCGHVGPSGQIWPST
jgi:hypothetical protein